MVDSYLYLQIDMQNNFQGEVMIFQIVDFFSYFACFKFFKIMFLDIT